MKVSAVSAGSSAAPAMLLPEPLVLLPKLAVLLPPLLLGQYTSTCARKSYCFSRHCKLGAVQVC